MNQWKNVDCTVTQCQLQCDARIFWLFSAFLSLSVYVCVCMQHVESVLCALWLELLICFDSIHRANFRSVSVVKLLLLLVCLAVCVCKQQTLCASFLYLRLLTMVWVDEADALPLFRCNERVFIIMHVRSVVEFPIWLLILVLYILESVCKKREKFRLCQYAFVVNVGHAIILLLLFELQYVLLSVRNDNVITQTSFRILLLRLVVT